MQNRRIFFTLLETLVVFFLLTMGLSLTGVKLYQAYQEQKVFSDIQQVLSHLNLAQDLMLILDTDTEVILTYHPDNNQTTCQLTVEKPLSKEWRKVVEREVTLNTIKSFLLEKIPVNPLKIRFSLGDMSKGTLILSTMNHTNDSPKNSDFKIVLTGIPGPITLSEKTEETREFYFDNQQLYPVEVYEELYSEKKIS